MRSTEHEVNVLHQIQVNDTVSFLFNRREMHGTVRRVGKKNAAVFVNGLFEMKTLPLTRLTYVPPFTVTMEEIRQLCRYEVNYSELTGGCPGHAPVILEEPYTITFGDVLAAMENIRASGEDNETIYNEWYSPLYYFMFDSLVSIQFESNPDDVETIAFLPDRATILQTLFEELLDDWLSMEMLNTETADRVTGIIRTALENERKPLSERVYTEQEKRHYISRLDNDVLLKKASGRELALLRQFTEELCKKDDITALRCKGYGCYGGNPAYECDWNVSLACVTRLYELTGEAVYANTLGYIYYYGRCWGGQPQYEEAFKYFSIGAAGNYYESRYKLADMFLNGYAVPKNTEIALGIIEELYDQNLPYIKNGNFDCKFADVALRLGGCMEKGDSGYVNLPAAYRFYLQADFAIRQRLRYGNYGDASVAARIRESLDRIQSSGEVGKPVKRTRIYLPGLLSGYLKQYRRLQMKIKPLKGGDLRLTICVAPLKEEKYHPKLFITEENTGFCGLLEALQLRVKNAEIQGLDEFPATVLFDDLAFSDDMDFTEFSSDRTERGIVFLAEGKIQAVLRGKCFFTSPATSADRKHRIASVCFSPGGRRYDYLLEIDDVVVGDTVIVMTGSGRTEVTVVDVSEKNESELALPFSCYKRILEKA